MTSTDLIDQPTEDDDMNKPQIDVVGHDAHYVVHNGWVNGRRTAIYSTYRHNKAKEELVSRLKGNKPNIKR